jgi:hypothetical protein
MTIAAFRALLDEIDRQGGPEAARHNRLHIPDDDRTSTVDTDTAPTPSLVAARPMPTAHEEAESLPVGKLLAWANEHPDPEVQDQAARLGAGLADLRSRYATDRELNAITSEAEQLERRLAELRSREQELAPAKPKARRAAPSYDAPAVRGWARANNIPCPAVGRVPKAVLDAWRQAGEPAA